MKHTDLPVEPRWQAVLLVCRQCGKRSSGPKSLKAKDVMKTLRLAARTQRPRPRVLVTGCLGLCPKKALAIARVGGPQAARLIGVKTTDEAEQALALLNAP